MSHVDKKPRLATFTIYVSMVGERDVVEAVDVVGTETIGAVRDRAAEVLKVEGGDITLWHEGEGLEGRVKETMLVEGSEVEARLSEGFVARRTLGAMGIGWERKDIEKLLWEVDKADQEKAETTGLILIANPNIDVRKTLIEACEMHFPETVRTLAPTAVNALWGKTTPLNIAAQDGRLELVKIFVEAGWDPNIVDSTNRTALHEACINKDLDMVKYLVGVGGNPCVVEDDSTTPLHIAAANGGVDIASVLVEAGAKLNDINETQRTPLHVAVQHGHELLSRRLIQAGSDIEAADHDELTPLHIAAESDFPNLTSLLLHSGSNPNASDESGETPLHLAAQHASLLVVELLIAAGADPTKKPQGDTPATLASKHGNTSIAEYLQSL